MSESFTSFVGGRICLDGELIESHLVISNSTGDIVSCSGDIRGDVLQLNGSIIAPGFLELQANGVRGFHFTHFENSERYATRPDEVARYLPSTGVTGFYPTIPKVASETFQKILPSLKPRELPDGASVLGAHVEGPYLHPSKKGAHDASLFQPPTVSPREVYGEAGESSDVIKLLTLAPEGARAAELIHELRSKGTIVSLGHSNASYAQGVAAVRAGATCLTHTLNAMAPLHHHDPGLAGLVTASPAAISSPDGPPYFTIIADGNHLHPSVATMLFRGNPRKCILITDSIEMAGLPDGTYAGHAQIPHAQTKMGSRVVIQGTETLIGGCATLQECVQNVIQWSGCSVAAAVKCVTENVADLMGEGRRGKLEGGRRADLTVLDEQGNVLQTWIARRRV